MFKSQSERLFEAELADILHRSGVFCCAREFGCPRKLGPQSFLSGMTWCRVQYGQKAPE